MKSLLLDDATTRIVSMVYSQTQILKQEVYLVEKLGVRVEPLPHMKAVLLIQPTTQNIDILCRELSDPKYLEYHIFFTNILSPNLLSRLGRADERDVVKQVQEYYCDFMAVNEDFFHLGAENSLSLTSTRTLESDILFDRNVNGLLSVLLAMRRRPSQIRYQATSPLARRMTDSVISTMKQNDVFEFRRSEGSLLLILDRRDDPVTPLLTQWTYQAMVHELLGFNNNRVLLRGVPNVPKDMEEIVLSPAQDDFFARNRYSNFGDLGVSAKALLEEYQRAAKLNENMNSIEDMQKFVDRYPQFKSQSINVSKHLTLISELSRLIAKCQLFDVSTLEQSVACNTDRSEHQRELFSIIENPSIDRADKLRLSLLYVLRYESYNEVNDIKRRLERQGLEGPQLGLFNSVLLYAGESVRAPGLFSGGEGGMVGMMSNFIRSTHTALKGVDNVFTQHQPVLSYLLDGITKGRVNKDLVLAEGSEGRVTEVVVFIVGGATFEEAACVAKLNQASGSSGLRVVLGGSCIHNSTSFLREVSLFR